MNTSVAAPRPKRKKKLRTDYLLCSMLIPGFIYLIVFEFIPIFGLVISFQDF